MKGRIAICATPIISGLFRFYSELRKFLGPLGWDTYAVSIGKHEASEWIDIFESEGCIKIATKEENEQLAAQKFVEWCIKKDINILMPMTGRISNAAVPHMPAQVRIITRCYSISKHSYDIVINSREIASRVIATSQRQEDDLLQKYSIPKSKVVLIPMGVDLKPFDSIISTREHAKDLLRLGFVGRLSNYDKGIFHLPKLLRLLSNYGVPFEFQIVGSGPDESALRRYLEPWHKQKTVRFLGPQPHKRIPEILSTMDVLVMTSNFEGFGISLIEAMVAGTVPVVSKIHGVTDWIVKNGVNGFVCPVGSISAFADAILKLYRSPIRLTQMSESAQSLARSRFSLEQMGKSYNELFSDVIFEKLRHNDPKPWKEFKVPVAFNPNWHRYIPVFIKKTIRRWMERIGKTV